MSFSHLLTGERHRRQRKMLNPIFSIKHLRNMTPLFYEIIHKVRDFVYAIGSLRLFSCRYHTLTVKLYRHAMR